MIDRKRYYVLSAVIFFSFLIMAAFSIYNEANEMRAFTVDREMPALGLAAYSRLNSTAAEYKRAGESLLQEDFIRDWIMSGEKDEEALLWFMSNVREKYGLLDASLVSDITETYYGTDGRVLKLSPENKFRDGWYYHYRQTVDESNIDSWFYPESGVIGLYVNIPVRDPGGNYIGVTGGGLDSTVFDEQLKMLEDDWKVKIYMIRNDGQLVYSTEKELLEPPVYPVDEIWGEPVMDRISRGKKNESGIILEPEGEYGPVLWAGYMVEWETFLVLERSTDVMRQTVWQSIIGYVVPGGFLTVALILLAAAAIRLVSGKARETVENSRGFVHRLQLVIHMQDLMLLKTKEVVERIAGNSEYKKIMPEEAEYAEHLLRNMKEEFVASKQMLSAKIQRSEEEIVNLNEVINNLLLRKNPALIEHNITLHSRISRRRSVISGNSVFLSFLVEELINRAADATVENSEMILFTGVEGSVVFIAIAFVMKEPGIRDFDFSNIKPALELMNASIRQKEQTRDGNCMLYLDFQLSGE